MTTSFIHHFLQTFFKENHCTMKHITEETITVQLTEELDKALMNRPFYWKYQESIGQKGEPFILTFNVNPASIEKKETEFVTYGSKRLQQMEQFLQNQAQVTKLYQVIDTNTQTMLQPWFVLNYAISYTGRQKKEHIYSIGLQLINGTMMTGMMEKLQQLTLAEAISDHCYTISPLITLQSGFKRIENYIDHQIESDDHQWAIEAQLRLKEELNMIQHFYDETTQNIEKDQEIEAAKERFSPTISYNIINYGLFYLKATFPHNEKTSTL